jgi:predicted O-methyltransferase YrrM
MQKPIQLLSVLLRRPGEFVDRLAAVAQVKLDRFSRRPPAYTATDWDSAIHSIGAELATELSIFLGEGGLRQIEEQVRKRTAAMPPDAPFESFHNGDLRLARLLYAICRIMKPTIVLETGTCYGVSSAFILKALQSNGAGALHSVDLPPLAKSGDRFVGQLIPDELRPRWSLYRGASRRVLPGLLSTLGKVDLFLHDSLHTYSNILMECEAVAGHLSRPSVVIVDDIQDNTAFLEWTARSKPSLCVAVQEHQKKALFGVALFLGRGPGK